MRPVAMEIFCLLLAIDQDNKFALQRTLGGHFKEPDGCSRLEVLDFFGEFACE